MICYMLLLVSVATNTTRTYITVLLPPDNADNNLKNNATDSKQNHLQTRIAKGKNNNDKSRVKRDGETKTFRRNLVEIKDYVYAKYSLDDENFKNINEKSLKHINDIEARIVLSKWIKDASLYYIREWFKKAIQISNFVDKDCESMVFDIFKQEYNAYIIDVHELKPYYINEMISIDIFKNLTENKNTIKILLKYVYNIIEKFLQKDFIFEHAVYQIILTEKIDNLQMIKIQKNNIQLDSEPIHLMEENKSVIQRNTKIKKKEENVNLLSAKLKTMSYNFLDFNQDSIVKTFENILCEKNLQDCTINIFFELKSALSVAVMLLKIFKAKGKFVENVPDIISEQVSVSNYPAHLIKKWKSFFSYNKKEINIFLLTDNISDEIVEILSCMTKKTTDIFDFSKEIEQYIIYTSKIINDVNDKILKFIELFSFHNLYITTQDNEKKYAELLDKKNFIEKITRAPTGATNKQANTGKIRIDLMSIFNAQLNCHGTYGKLKDENSTDIHESNPL